MVVDLVPLNAELLNQFKTTLGAAPGKFREENPQAYNALRTEPIKVYLEKGPTPGEMAKAFNNLSFGLRRLGYGHETIFFADLSTDSDPENVSQIINNKSFEAYAVGMMNGDYERGLELYDALDAYMQKHGKFDQTARIKSLQNKGQILHRMGMEDPANYKCACSNYDTALELLPFAKLDSKTEALFDSQLRYCRAKTLLYRAHVEPENASTLIQQAYSDISIATFAAKVPGFEFEYGCMKVVKGCIEVSIGAKDEGLRNIAEGYGLQKQYGSTLTPRHVSTESKFEAAAHGKISQAKLAEMEQNLADFHGHQRHPDRKFLVQTAERAATPISGLRL